jgi:hypothetical protein
VEMDREQDELGKPPLVNPPTLVSVEQ